MRYLYKKGERVVSRLYKRAGKVSATANYPQEGYRVYFDATADSDPKLIFSLEENLYPEAPTYDQAKRELCRALERIIAHEKIHLELLHESMHWAKTMKALMPLEDVVQVIAGNEDKDGAAAPMMADFLKKRN